MKRTVSRLQGPKESDEVTRQGVWKERRDTSEESFTGNTYRIRAREGEKEEEEKTRLIERMSAPNFQIRLIWV